MTSHGTVSLEDALRLTAAQVRSASGARLAAVLQYPANSHPVIAAADAAPGVDPTEVVRAITEGALGGERVLVVPLPVHLSDPGALMLTFEGHQQATAGERELAAEFADRAALVVDRAHASAQRAELAALVARQRTARDINDDVIQRLYAAGLRLRGTQGVDDTARRDRAVEETVAELDLAIQGIRTTMRALD